MRRLLDIAFALFCLTLTAPISICLAILIKLDSPGPILYSPRMLGQYGREFHLFRFRTMSSRQSDPAFTRVGSFIRNYSLDHIPQLINVLRGDLTIIGPRPMEADLVNPQDRTWQSYFQLKPGLFNYAVLKLGRQWNAARLSHPSLNQELELEYAQKRSAILDIKMFVQFFHEFVRSGGNVKARGKPDAEKDQEMNIK